MHLGTISLEENMINEVLSMLSQLLYHAGHALISGYARLMLRMDVLWHTALPPGPVVFAANHPSTTDPIFIHLLSPRPMSVMISHGVFSIPVLGDYMRRMGQIEVTYGQGERVLDQALATLHAGRIVTIFPEGTVSPPGGFAPVRTGVARLALRSGVPVVPVGIALAGENCRCIPTMLEGRPEVITWYVRGPYAITIGSPLRFEGDVFDQPLVRSVAEKVMERIRALALESRGRMDLGRAAIDPSCCSRCATNPKFHEGNHCCDPVLSSTWIPVLLPAPERYEHLL